jgi:hypothetical protein
MRQLWTGATQVPEGLPPPCDQIIRGYRVHIIYQPIDPQEAAARRKILVEVMARSVMRSIAEKQQAE